MRLLVLALPLLCLAGVVPPSYLAVTMVAANLGQLAMQVCHHHIFFPYPTPFASIHPPFTRHVPTIVIRYR
jgi:hypothetical protein